MRFGWNVGDRRSLAHYVVACLIVSLYGYAVCEFIDGLPISYWAGTLVPVLAVVWLTRTWISRYVSRLPLDRQPALAMAVETASFTMAGLILGSINTYVHGFPVASGLKAAVGFMAVGVFAGVDQAMIRVILRFDQGGLQRPIRDVSASLAIRIGIAGGVVMGFAIVIAALLAARIMESGLDHTVSKTQLAIEFLFVFVVFLAYLANLGHSYGRIVQRGLAEQMTALAQSRSGLGKTRAVVGTNDEIGLVATEINFLLDALSQAETETVRAHEATIRGLVSLAGARDNETGDHLRRTQLYLECIARQLALDPAYRANLSDETITRMIAAAPLHDIGKVAIPDAVLRKPGKLDAAEFEVMKTHVNEGIAVIDKVTREVGVTPFLAMARDIIAGHYEKFDGSGYPRQLKGQEIALAGRIMAVADVYDALRSQRVYKPALSREAAREIILAGAGSHFDPVVVAAFLLVEPAIDRIATELMDRPGNPATERRDPLQERVAVA